MDTYLHLCASALAATIVLRSILAATFPLFTDQMFSKLGDQWGASVFAFLALLCTPLPFLFYVGSSPLCLYWSHIIVSHRYSALKSERSHISQANFRDRMLKRMKTTRTLGSESSRQMKDWFFFVRKGTRELNHFTLLTRFWKVDRLFQPSFTGPGRRTSGYTYFMHYFVCRADLLTCYTLPTGMRTTSAPSRPSP